MDITGGPGYGPPVDQTTDGARAYLKNMFSLLPLCDGNYIMLKSNVWVACGRSVNHNSNLSWQIIPLTVIFPKAQKIHRWADKFCLHCNIFIYIRHIWIKPVLCSRMVPLFQHTSPWTHRFLQSSSSAHRNWRVFRRPVQTACCYWILNCGKSSSNWNSQTNASRLWWSVCWCEYSKMLGKAVQRWRIGANRFELQNTNFKNWCSVGRSALKCMVIL